MANLILHHFIQCSTDQTDTGPKLISALAFGVSPEPVILRLPDRDLRITLMTGLSSKASDATYRFEDALGSLDADTHLEVLIFEVNEITHPAFEEDSPPEEK